jgi:hypothetical protein
MFPNVLILHVPQRPHPNNRQVNFALEICYVPCLALAKLSILSLYARIFRTENKSFKIAVYLIGAWIILWAVGVYLEIFLSCRPIETYWTEFCSPTYTTSVTTGVLNIISDVALLILPQPFIWRLHMKSNRKIGLSVVMMMGVL